VARCRHRIGPAALGAPIAGALPAPLFGWAGTNVVVFQALALYGAALLWMMLALPIRDARRRMA
jgi:hypothetical protein